MIPSLVGETPVCNCISEAWGTLDNTLSGCSILRPEVSTVVWQRRRLTETVAIKAESDTLLSLLHTVLHDVMGCDADGDPLQIVRRCIPRPRSRSL